jgi:FKBP-type peptidyl-prolyl cis-trans isomerase FklB
MKMHVLPGIMAVTLAVLIAGCSAPDSGKVVLKDRNDSISYVIGLDYGTGLKMKQVEYNPAAVYKGLEDVLNGKDMIPDTAAKIALINEVNQFINNKLLEQFNAMLAGNKKTGSDFLMQNKATPGVVELPSGMQYKIIANGATNNRPAPQDSVVIHYQTMFVDRTLVEETYGNAPARFAVGGVNKGLSEGLQLMNPGAIYEFYIPSELSFGDKNFVDQRTGRVKVPAGSTLIYKVELLQIK